MIRTKSHITSSNRGVACRASYFIELPCQTSFCPFLFFVSLLSAAQHLTPAVVCDSSFYYGYSCIIIVCV